MTSEVLLYIGSAIVIVWGIAHMVPTKSVVSGFGPISADSRRILTMEWFAEGVTLCFVGVLVLLVSLSLVLDRLTARPSPSGKWRGNVVSTVHPSTGLPWVHRRAQGERSPTSRSW